jgi:hypothetical protein
MKDKILKLLQEKEDSTSQGFTIVGLVNALNLPISELKLILTDLHKENKIKVRKGINGKIIYLK